MSDVTECSGCGEPIAAAGCERCRYDSEAGYLKAQLAAVKKERDAATGALAAAMDEVAWLTAEVEARATNSPALVEISDHGLRFLSSPAADLAARHDAEVERRALEKAADLCDQAEDPGTWLVPDSQSNWQPSDVAASAVRAARCRLASEIRALATPTPEKPKP